jgi:hypothetical protein
VLKRRLGNYHDIKQIAIFSDSCRSWAADNDTADLDLAGVLGATKTRQDVMPPIDKFVAAQDGAATFMIPGDTPAEDRCLFSGVLMEGLWGLKPAAFSEIRKKVTSQSLGAFLRSEAPKVAQRYMLNLNPNVTPLFLKVRMSISLKVSHRTLRPLLHGLRLLHRRRPNHPSNRKAALLSSANSMSNRGRWPSRPTQALSRKVRESSPFGLLPECTPRWVSNRIGGLLANIKPMVLPSCLRHLPLSLLSSRMACSHQ